MNQTVHPIEPEELMAYLDGELSADRERSAVAHLAECKECQEMVAGLRTISQSLQTWKVESAESEMPLAVAEALEHPTRAARRIVPDKRRSWNLGRRWGTVAWAGGLAALVGISFLSWSPLRARKSASMYEVESGQPTAAPAASPGADKQFAKLNKAPAVILGNEPKQSGNAVNAARAVAGPMIIRTEQLALITKDFDKARHELEIILNRHRGFVGELKVGGVTGSGRTLTATLRVPADQLDATATDLKTLGRVDSESQTGQDVTSQYVDLEARLANARNTEQRLTDLLRNRTGKLSDVLEVEQEIDRVRGEIEQMEAEKKSMANQVTFATVNVTLTEDYRAQLQVVPPSTFTRLSNAAVEGYRSVVDGVLDVTLFLLTTGPILLLWAAILFFPARFVWRRVHREVAD